MMYGPEVTFADDTIKLTTDLICDLEGKIRNYMSENPQKSLLDSFNRGNDQINYGYTDKGLNLANSKDAINFDEMGTQLAYVYRFFASHVLIVGELLLSASGWHGINYSRKDHPVVHDLRAMNEFLDRMSRQAVTVTCFGGGPGSEVAAIVAWLRTEGLYSNISFRVVDKYLNWKDVAHRVGRFADTEINFQENDFLTSTPARIQDLVKDTDIICMSKFLSALTAHRALAEKNLTQVLRYMKPGAILIFFDNSGGGITKWLTKLALNAQLYEVFAVPHFSARVHKDCLSVNDRRSQFKVKVTDSLNVGMKIFMKHQHLANHNPVHGYREPVQGPIQGYCEPTQGYCEPTQGYCEPNSNFTTIFTPNPNFNPNYNPNNIYNPNCNPNHGYQNQAEFNRFKEYFRVGPSRIS